MHSLDTAPLRFRVLRFPVGVAINTDIRKRLAENFPFEVDVVAEDRSEKYRSPCLCSVVYRIEDLHILFMKNLLPAGLHEHPCVCPCMGNVIERRRHGA